MPGVIIIVGSGLVVLMLTESYHMSVVGVLLLFLVSHVCCDCLVTVLRELAAILGLLVACCIMGRPCCLAAAGDFICHIVVASGVTDYRLYVAYPTFSAMASFVYSGSFVIKLIDVSFFGAGPIHCCLIHGWVI